MQTRLEGVIIELTVNNHPGVMSHICGLFSRRSYNLERILCIPQKNSNESKMWLQVNEDKKLDQVIKQIEKLEDVKHLILKRENFHVFLHTEESACYS